MSDMTDSAPQGLVAGGFYTETLARIYWRQGFLREALQMYRRLAAERPDELRLQNHIRTLSEELAVMSADQNASLHTTVSDRLLAAAPAVPTDWRYDAIRRLERWLVYLQRQRHSQAAKNTRAS